jgi:hypothetical protein
MAVPFADARFGGAAAVDEPTITLRASDPAIMETLRAYMAATADRISPAGETTDARPTYLVPLSEFKDDVAAWRRANGYNVATA